MLLDVHARDQGDHGLTPIGPCLTVLLNGDQALGIDRQFQGKPLLAILEIDRPKRLTKRRQVCRRDDLGKILTSETCLAASVIG